jgi:ribosomal protein S18 acetylase RimI-like enzyme
VDVRLRPLRDDEFDAYVEHGKVWYARDLAENGGAPPELAKKKADEDWALLLPDRLASPGHHISAVEEVATGERVGYAWLAERDTQFEGKVAFVYSIEIDERFRGRGFGKQAMLLLEDDARALGLTRISLNVFGGNEVARSLYKSLGYAEAAVMMAKDLGSGSEA